MFDSPERMMLGLATGIVFGFLLQKGGVAKHAVIVGQLILRDHTVIKIMLTAIAVGSVGFWGLVSLGMTPVEVKPAEMGGILTGAVLFGLGLAVVGYCPGTTLAAVGEGRRDAVMAALGMFVGAFAFVQAFEQLSKVQKAAADFGTITLPSATPIPAGAWVAGLLAVVMMIYLGARMRRARRFG